MQNTQTQMAQLEQLITLLMINKKLIVSSEQLRKEAIPKLNIMQIKQVLAMYMPTGACCRSWPMCAWSIPNGPFSQTWRSAYP